MSDSQLPQGWDKVMQPIIFDEIDFDTSWMADDSLLVPHQQATFVRDAVITDDRGALSNFHFTAPASSNGRDVPALNSLQDNWTSNEFTQPAAEDSNILTERPFLCAHCSAGYRRVGDLTRHQKEKHTTASSKYLCHIELCPRGIVGEGFGRMHHLVAHLKSNKHGMDGMEAAYAARQNNLPKSKVTATGREGGMDVL